jgi:hypothetical protein
VKCREETMTRIKLREENIKKISKALTRENKLVIKDWGKRTN